MSKKLLLSLASLAVAAAVVAVAAFTWESYKQHVLNDFYAKQEKLRQQEEQQEPKFNGKHFIYYTDDGRRIAR